MSGPRVTVDGVRDLARDVQRFGLLSATSVVERYVDLVDQAVGKATTPAPSRPGDRPWDPLLGGDTSALIDSATRVAEAYLGLLDAASSMTQRDAAAARLVLAAVRPGATSQAPLYVHNPGSDPSGALTVTMGSLMAADGACLREPSVRCVPARVEGIAPHGSVRLDVSVHVPSDQPPGIYHGVVVSSLAPAEPIGIMVEVLEP